MTTFAEFVSENGFAVLPGVFEEGEISVLSGKLSSANLNRSRAGARHVLANPEVRSIANSHQLLDLARRVLGPNAIPFRGTLFDKSMHTNWLVAWHQDTALPFEKRIDVAGWGPWSIKEGIDYAHAPADALEKILALRVHLDDSSEANGPLRVLPGTHRSGVLTDDEILKISDEAESKSCTVTAGGVIAMRPLIIHASSKSRSETPRRVLHIEYAAETIFDGLRLAIA